MMAIWNEMSGTDQLIGGVVLIVTGSVLGLISNAILRERGFGTVLNGLLLLLGALGGVAMRSATVGF